MSYDIVYDRQFIRTADNRIIPLALAGSNNLWENDNKRRVRSWSSITVSCNTLPALTPNALMADAVSRTGGEYQQHFMRYGKWVDDAAFLRFFQNGIRGAKTLAELRDAGLCDGSLRCYLSVWTDVPGDSYGKHTEEKYTYVRTDDALLTFLTEADSRLQSRAENEHIYVCVEFSEDEPLPKPKKYRQRKERLSENFYVVTMRGAYVTRLTRGGLHRSPYVSSAKQFATSTDAEKWLDRNKIAIRFQCEVQIQKVA